jgi:hypothetical protein
MAEVRLLHVLGQRVDLLDRAEPAFPERGVRGVEQGEPNLLSDRGVLHRTPTTEQ